MNNQVKICYGCMRRMEGNVCSCGWRYHYTREEAITLLAPGTLLGQGQYRIGRKIGQGGFGITYLGARQDRLGICVAIKEYFPGKLVHRNICSSNEVFPNHPPGMPEADARSISDRFEKGKQAFIEEARRLAGFNELSSIVSVLGYVEENNTAYIIMEYIDGIDLLHYMQNLGRTLTFAEVRRYIFPMMKDLDEVHKSGIIHRDISPDNIMITHNGNVKLIDFGASVSQEGEEEVKLLRKNGFAPLEQYEKSGGHLGPWTDVYALCATIFMLLTGRLAPDARERQKQDLLPSFQDMQVLLPGSLEKVLKKGLSLDYKKRYQSMRELSRKLGKVRDYRRLRYGMEAVALLAAGIAVMGVSTLRFADVSAVSGFEERDMSSLRPQEGTEAGKRADSAFDYAVFDDLVYIRYIFEDGVIMLARSPVGADDISKVEYVTDGPIGNFCVYGRYLYFVSLEDRHLYRMDLEGGAKDWEKISKKAVDQSYPFCILDEYVYALLQNADGSHEFQRISLDGGDQEVTSLHLPLLLCRFYGGYIYMTTKEEGGTALARMKADGTYYETLRFFAGNVPAMMLDDGKIYYLFNAAEEGPNSYMGCMEVNGTEDRILANLNNEQLEYCDMTGIVDGNHIYYTCSRDGSEMLNNLYCYSLSDESNKQISSECGRYVATSDEIDYIIFAASDGSEIRQMNKDGSNPRVMREPDGSTGVRERVDVTSLAIIADHVYYLDGENVAYKQIIEDEL